MQDKIKTLEDKLAQDEIDLDRFEELMEKLDKEEAEAKNPKPNPNKVNPSPNFIGPEILYLLSHHLEKTGAKQIINKEFKIPNQDAGTSALIVEKFKYTFQITIPQIIRKLNPKILLPRV